MNAKDGGDGKEVGERNQKEEEVDFRFVLFRFFHSSRRRAFDPLTPPSQYLISTGRGLLCVFDVSLCLRVRTCNCQDGLLTLLVSQSVGSESFSLTYYAVSSWKYKDGHPTPLRLDF